MYTPAALAVHTQALFETSCTTAMELLQASGLLSHQVAKNYETFLTMVIQMR